MTSLARRSGASIIRSTIGVFPAYDLRLKMRGLPAIVRARRFERSEAARLRELWGTPPTARVVTVIPTYDRPAEVLRAIDSALAQTIEDHAVVVIDDGAGLPEIPPHPRLFAASLSRNEGTVSVTRNVGILATESEFLAFLDDDNTWAPTHLETALAAHAEGAELTYSAIERVDTEGTPIDVFSVPFDRRAARETSIADANAIVVRRSRHTVFSRAPRPYGSFPREDWEFVYRLSRRLETRHLPEVTVTYTVHDGSFYTDWAL